uniref:Phosphoglycerate dehydrogenase n=1 Tax=Weissella thailandensis fsh4-2 TaxID=1056112 RepID=G0UFM7_9LACO|nr:phosphoglycerate dehydrogenase [Weissella thailandensis fsh4-2]
MTELLLAVQPLRKQEATILKNQGIDIVTPATVTDEQLQDVTISYGWSPELGDRLLAAPDNKLRWVQYQGAGVDLLPLATFAEQHILVTNASGVKAPQIAQTVVSYLMHFARGLHVYQEQHLWHEYEDQYTLDELPTVIFGTGKIGQKIAAYLSPYGMPIYGVNSSGKQVPGFDKVFALNNLLFEWPDGIQVIINTLPDTPATHHYFNSQNYKIWGELFLLVNVGRGGTVDEKELIASLQSGRIRYAALDVTEVEPIPADSMLWQQRNLLLTQHTSWANHTYPERRSGDVFRILSTNLSAYLNGEPLIENVVDLTKGY